MKNLSVSCHHSEQPVDKLNQAHGRSSNPVADIKRNEAKGATQNQDVTDFLALMDADDGQAKAKGLAQDERLAGHAQLFSQVSKNRETAEQTRLLDGALQQDAEGSIEQGELAVQDARLPNAKLDQRDVLRHGEQRQPHTDAPALADEHPTTAMNGLPSAGNMQQPPLAGDPRLPATPAQADVARAQLSHNTGQGMQDVNTKKALRELGLSQQDLTKRSSAIESMMKDTQKVDGDSIDRQGAIKDISLEPDTTYKKPLIDTETSNLTEHASDHTDNQLVSAAPVQMETYGDQQLNLLTTNADTPAAAELRRQLIRHIESLYRSQDGDHVRMELSSDLLPLTQVELKQDAGRWVLDFHTQDQSVKHWLERMQGDLQTHLQEKGMSTAININFNEAMDTHTALTDADVNKDELLGEMS